jgi:hypothetical protein
MTNVLAEDSIYVLLKYYRDIIETLRYYNSFEYSEEYFEDYFIDIIFFY